MNRMSHAVSHALRIGLGFALAAGTAACSSSADSTAPAKATTTVSSKTTTSRPTKFVAEVWADNWFELWVNGQKVGQDSVPITTVRSFNSERISFTATYPLTIGIVGKDYVEDASGLEYVGTPRQQIGDGGLIAQIRDERTGKVVAATSADWTQWVISRAPLDAACAKSTNPVAECESRSAAAPAGWATPKFDNSVWNAAVEYTAAQVGAKEGYTEVVWEPSAHLVWSGDLKLDNTVLFRSAAIPQPPS